MTASLPSEAGFKASTARFVILSRISAPRDFQPTYHHRYHAKGSPAKLAATANGFLAGCGRRRKQEETRILKSRIFGCRRYGGSGRFSCPERSGFARSGRERIEDARLGIELRLGEAHCGEKGFAHFGWLTGLKDVALQIAAIERVAHHIRAGEVLDEVAALGDRQFDRTVLGRVTDNGLRFLALVQPLEILQEAASHHHNTAVTWG